jgi:hypothetical protein
MITVVVTSGSSKTSVSYVVVPCTVTVVLAHVALEAAQLSCQKNNGSCLFYAPNVRATHRRQSPGETLSYAAAGGKPGTLKGLIMKAMHHTTYSFLN